jgi:hypothetical protein
LLRVWPTRFLGGYGHVDRSPSASSEPACGPHQAAVRLMDRLSSPRLSGSQEDEADSHGWRPRCPFFWSAGRVADRSRLTPGIRRHRSRKASDAGPNPARSSRDSLFRYTLFFGLRKGLAGIIQKEIARPSRCFLTCALCGLVERPPIFRRQADAQLTILAL